jgi:hypothetical protein
MVNKISFIVALLFVSIVSYSQENSPFSRYGIGDIYPQQSIATRGMGGISAAFTSPQAINTINPASYGAINLVTYDFGVSIDSRTLVSAVPPQNYKSVNFTPSYLQLGLPLSRKARMGLVFGLRPATRINYSIRESKSIYYDSLGYADSLQNVYEGNGGMNQVYLGIGKTWRSKDSTKAFNSFSLGFNTGYEWGTKFISTKTSFPADSSFQNWYESNSTDTTRYWGMFFSPGFQATITVAQHQNPISKLRHAYVLGMGASGTLQQNLDASRNISRQTITYTDAGEIVPIDSILKSETIHGKINLPVSYTGGLMFTKYIINGPFQYKEWGVGVDYSATQWSKYLFYGSPDQVRNSWMLRIGGEFSPNPLTGKSIFSTGTYRVGFYTGEDYINADGNGYKVQAFTVGYSFNLRKFHSYDNQFTMINTALEFGKRGSKVNNITENFFKLSVGLSLSDIWFIKRKYD